IRRMQMRLFKKNDIIKLLIFLVLLIILAQIFGYYPADNVRIKKFKKLLKMDSVNMIIISEIHCGPCRMMKRELIDNKKFRKRNPKLNIIVYNVDDPKKGVENRKVLRLLVKRHFFNGFVGYPSYFFIILNKKGEYDTYYETGGYGPGTNKRIEEILDLIMNGWKNVGSNSDLKWYMWKKERGKLKVK
ncbi:hypothetical protein J7L48_07695, partial [bacterium]|nr:hypothetical protein [bacterium]